MSFYRTISAFIIATLISIMSASSVYAETTSFELPEGDVLVISGEDFRYEKRLTDENVFEEFAVWEGNVTATFGDIEMITEKITAKFDGAEVSRMTAEPKVSLTGMQGRAKFECANVVIDFPTESNGLEAYTGTCQDVRGYYLARASDFGLLTDETYEINFTSNTAVLGETSVILTRPVLSLGNPDKPDIAFTTRQATVPIGMKPKTGKSSNTDEGVQSDEKVALGIAATDLSIILYGVRINLLWFPVWRGFYPSNEPGLSFPLPRPGWENSQGFSWDQSVVYDFSTLGEGGGPWLALRIHSFPADRTYPELIFSGDGDTLKFEAHGGYFRGEDGKGKPVAVRAEPSLKIDTVSIPLGNNDFQFHAGVFWGQLREMTDGISKNRWGYSGTIDGFRRLDETTTINGSIEFFDRYYSDSGNYTSLFGTIKLQYYDYPKWGASVAYRKTWEWGTPGFRFEQPQTLEDIRFRQQNRFSDDWGGGLDFVYDLDEDEFERQQIHITRILDSFQISLGWDFRNDTIRAEFNLPGSLN